MKFLKVHQTKFLIHYMYTCFKVWNRSNFCLYPVLYINNKTNQLIMAPVLSIHKNMPSKYSIFMLLFHSHDQSCWTENVFMC